MEVDEFGIQYRNGVNSADVTDSTQRKEDKEEGKEHRVFDQLSKEYSILQNEKSTLFGNARIKVYRSRGGRYRYKTTVRTANIL